MRPDFGTIEPAAGWLGVVARVQAGEHAVLSRRIGKPWSCTCSSCTLARRDVALLALRRAMLDAGTVGLVLP